MKQVMEHQAVLFRLGKERYAVSIYEVSEIIRVPSFTVVPGTAPHVLGIFSLRGSVLPAICLRRRLRLGEPEINGDSRLLIFEYQDEKVGLLVDAVEEVIKFHPENLVHNDHVGRWNDDVVTGIIQRDEQLIALLSVDSLIHFEDLLQTEDLFEETLEKTG